MTRRDGPSPEPVVYDFVLRRWTGACPMGDVCSGCDALGYCSRMEPHIGTPADSVGLPVPASGLPAVREPDEPREMTAEEVERALQIGPPDFLLGEGFDAENGPGASDELRRLGEENARG